MRDTRKVRAALVIVVTAAAGALIGDMYLKPLLEKYLGVKV